MNNSFASHKPAFTYRHHGEKDEAGGRSLLGALAGVDQAIDRRGREHQAAAEVADERDMICLDAVGRNHDEDANDDGDVED